MRDRCRFTVLNCRNVVLTVMWTVIALQIRNDNFVSPFTMIPLLHPLSRETFEPFSLYDTLVRPKMLSKSLTSSKASTMILPHETKSVRNKKSTMRLRTQLKRRKTIMYRRKLSMWQLACRDASESALSVAAKTKKKMTSLSLPIVQAVSDYTGIVSSRIPSSIDTAILYTSVETIRKATEATVDRVQDVAYTSAMNFWYLIPSTLCVVPLFTIAVWQTIPVTPTVWKLVNMDFVWRTAPCAQWAISVVAAFLASNASYFLGALYLFQKSGMFTQNGVSLNETNKMTGRKIIPASLGWWIFCAGCMSTLFHTVQAVGDYRIAEALCYLDHGVAGTAVLYFLYTCGRPSMRALLIGVAGLVTLAFPAAAICPPAYTWLHSLWHALSAIAAIFWANDSKLLQSSSSISHPTAIAHSSDSSSK